MSVEQAKCGTCGGDVQPIRLNDATHRWIDMSGAGHVEPTYSAPDATASLFTQTVPPEGVVKARICTQCGQISLFGRCR